MTIFYRITKSSALLFVSSLPTNHILLIKHRQSLCDCSSRLKFQRRPLASISPSSLRARSTQHVVSFSSPIEASLGSISSISVMARRSARLSSETALTRSSQINDSNKIDSPLKTVEPFITRLNSTAKKTQSKNEGGEISVSKEEEPMNEAKRGVDSRENDTANSGRKKRKNEDEPLACSEQITTKTKTKSSDHQRWTERVPLSRLWTPDKDSYTFTVLSWNIAGLRTFIKKNPDTLSDLAKKYQVDVMCLQETKLQEENLADPKLKLKDYFDKKLPNYECYFNCAVEKKGYAGTAMFIMKYSNKASVSEKPQNVQDEFFETNAVSENKVIYNEEGKHTIDDIFTSKLKPVSISNGLGIPAHDGEGRIITAEFPLFYLTNVYVPNSGQNLDRLSYRTNQWDKDFLAKMCKLRSDGNKSIIWLGDLNVAHNEKDTWNEGAKHLVKSAGTTPEERASFEEQLSAGFTDTFRHLHPEGRGHYSYWSQRAGNREPNKGLRLDYFICSKEMIQSDGSIDQKAIVRDSYMLPDQLGSDHCPIVLEIEILK